MSYLHIENLYKNKDILLFKKCYAMEKIHGTSAHISWDGNKIIFFSGGEKYENFINIFDQEKLKNKFIEMGFTFTIYGEAYGGKCQGMKHTYGEGLKFIGFETNIGGKWLCVPDAEKIVRSFNLDFVHYDLIDTNIETLDYYRDQPSIQARKNGILEDKKREGIVLRPLIEVIKNNGSRIIAKHKADAFQETKTKRNLNEDKLKILEKAEEIADEWVTLMRLSHVLQNLIIIDETQTGIVINLMIEDIEREAKGEIIESKEVRKMIGKRTVLLFKQYLKEKINV
jgi:hypothetical protein